MRKRAAATPQRLRVSVLGDLRHHEFAVAAAWLKQHATVVAELARVPSDRSCIGSLATSATNCELIVLACARRGEFTADDVARLRSDSPLARIVALTGSWCDGPWRRSFDLLPGVAVVPWHRWRLWASVNLRQLAGRRAATWSLPETSTADELADFWSVQPLGEDRGLILIDASNAESAEVLADVVRACGFSAVWQSPAGGGFIDGVRAIVSEADDVRPATLDRIAQLSRRFAPSPVVAVTNFPRVEDIERILAAGAAAVVGKPFTLHEILAQLENALRREGRSISAAA